MAAKRRSTRRLLTTKRFTATRILVLSSVIGLPALGLFCIQWAPATFAPYERNQVHFSEPSLNPMVGVNPYPGIQADETTDLTTAQGFLRRANSSTIRSNRQAMISAAADPFYEALSAGMSEGMLVLQSAGRDVPTFRAPRSERRQAPASDQALLKEIRIELAGSFENFLENMFGNPASHGTVAVAEVDQNPFTKAADAGQTAAKDDGSAAKQNAGSAGKTDAANETKQDTAKSKQDTASGGSQSGASTPDDSQSALLPGPFGFRASDANTLKVVRPHVLMHVNNDGTLSAFPALRIREQSFETAEMGVRQFNPLIFSQPAENGTSLAAADLNGDGIPDICALDSRAGLLHFYYGAADGGFSEKMRVDVGSGPRSIAAGDFNRDGRADIAISSIGVGTLTLLYLGDPGAPPAFKSGWLDAYRDAIVSADMTGTGTADLVGISFPNLAQVLNAGRDGALPGKPFTCAPAMVRNVSTLFGYQLQLSATLLKSNLSVQLQNYQNQTVNIVNVQAGTDIFVIVGDLNNENAVSVALATLRK